MELACDTACTFQTKVKYDKDGNVTPDSEYKSPKEAYGYMMAHWMTASKEHYSCDDREEEYGVRKVTKTIKTCKWCGLEKK